MPVEFQRAARALRPCLNMDQLDAAPGLAAEALRHRCDVILAIDGDMPAALHEEKRQMLGERLEAAMGRGNAARAEDQDGGTRVGHGSSSPEAKGIPA